MDAVNSRKRSADREAEKGVFKRNKVIVSNRYVSPSVLRRYKEAREAFRQSEKERERKVSSSTSSTPGGNKMGSSEKKEWARHLSAKQKERIEKLLENLEDGADEGSTSASAAGGDSSAAGDSEGLPWHAAPDGPEWKGIPWCLIHKQTGQPAMRGCGYPPSSAVDVRDSTEYVMRKDKTRKHGVWRDVEVGAVRCCTILAWKL